VHQAGRQVAYILCGALLGVVALLTLIAALVLVLATIVPLWKSALVVGLAIVVVAVALAFKGVSGLREASFVPRETVATLREDKRWVEQHVR
jgi:sulfite exporter TauE/SafE